MTGKQLQAMIDKVGQTQVGMARAIGISDRQMRRYCGGKSAVPLTVELAVRWIVHQHDETKRLTR